jgi:hypothetical protein
MVKKKEVKGSQVVKTKGGLTIKYVPILYFKRLLKKHLSLSKWQKHQTERIEKFRGTPKWEEESRKFRIRLLEKKAALIKMERVLEAKRNQGLPDPLLRPSPPRDYGIDRILSLTHWKNKDLWPSEIVVGYPTLESGGPVIVPSNLIYPCPDDGKGRRWSAWFQNNYVELYRRSTYTIEGGNFTGNLKIRMHEYAEGVADINAGGYVSLGVGASTTVWRNTGSEDQSAWRLIDVKSGYRYPNVKTTNTGLVSLEPAEISHSWEFSLASPGDVVKTSQYVSVKAVNADVQMGYNREDCASGNGVGYIYTSMPSLDLQYFNLIKPRLEEIPSNFPWS